MKGYSFICPGLIYILSQPAARAILCWSVWRAWGGGQAVEGVSEKVCVLLTWRWIWAWEPLCTTVYASVISIWMLYWADVVAFQATRWRKTLLVKCQQVPVNLYKFPVHYDCFMPQAAGEKWALNYDLCVGGGKQLQRRGWLHRRREETRVRVKERGKMG